MRKGFGMAKAEDGSVAEATRVDGDPPRFKCVVRKYGRKVAEYEFEGWLLNLDSVAKCALERYRKEIR